MLQAEREREMDAAMQASRAATEALMVEVVAAAERDKAAAVRAQEEEAVAARRREVARVVAAVEAETAAECARVREAELAKLAVEVERDKDAAIARIKLAQELESERRKRALRDDREAAIAAAEAEARRQWQEGWEATVASEVMESERLADAAKRRVREELNAQHAAKVRRSHTLRARLVTPLPHSRTLVATPPPPVQVDELRAALAVSREQDVTAQRVAWEREQAARLADEMAALRAADDDAIRAERAAAEGELAAVLAEARDAAARNREGAVAALRDRLAADITIALAHGESRWVRELVEVVVVVGGWVRDDAFACICDPVVCRAE